MRQNLDRYSCGLAILVIAAAAVLMSRAAAGDGCCHHCGRAEACQKICRLERADRKITTTCWGYQCEDFCVPDPSCKGCVHEEFACTECADPKGPFTKPKLFVWADWFPSECGTVYTRKKLMKRTVTKTVPGYKWTVEELCTACESQCMALEVPASACIPPAPTLEDAKVIAPHVAPAAEPELKK